MQGTDHSGGDNRPINDRGSATSYFESTFANALEAACDEQFHRERFVLDGGPLSADVVLGGEVPGEPFVGRAGQQLDRALESIGYAGGVASNAF